LINLYLSMDKKNNIIKADFLTLLFLMLLFLKLGQFGVVAEWSWWWVTAPLWVPAAAAIIYVVVILLINVFKSND